ncbi:MAG: hypothetical protein LBG06_05480 [Deltaproteobacteria bacterium]|nr:hypothetical protein [Deltaproteobacteria bacterium]
MADTRGRPGRALAEAVRLRFRALGRAGTPEALAALLDIASRRAGARPAPPGGDPAERPEEREAREGAYAGRLLADGAETLAVWDTYAEVRPLERGFFADPRAFEEIPELVREWSAFAEERRLTALVLGCGRGWGAVSLAASLAAAGLPERNWEIDITGLDLSPRALALAAGLRFDRSALDGFPYPQGRWFRAEAGGVRRFRDGEGASLSFGFGDPYLAEGPDARRPPDDPEGAGPGAGAGPPPDAGSRGGRDTPRDCRLVPPGGLENLLPRFRGRVDVLLARFLSREAPDELAGRLPEAVAELLREGGLAFTGPGEIWAPGPGLTLEARNGVFYFRKSRGRRKANTFHTPRRGRAARGPLPAPAPAHAPGRYEGLAAASRQALPEGPEKARRLALDAVTLSCEDMLVWPPAYEALAEAEEALGRGGFARQIREAMGIYARGG